LARGLQIGKFDRESSFQQGQPQKQPKRGRLWLNDGSCVRLRPQRRNHVWSYDFVMDRTHDGKPFRMLCAIDEFTRECLAIRVERRLNARIVLEVLADLFLSYGPPDHIRSDNGSRVHREGAAGMDRTARR
jgi:transposase InsO family protein